MDRVVFFLLILFGGTAVVQGQDVGVIIEFLDRAEQMQYNDRDSAIFFASKAFELTKSAGDSELHAKALNRLGALYYVSGDYDKSFSHFLSAKEISERLGDVGQTVFSMNGIGLIYLAKKSYADAIEMWEKCLVHNRAHNDTLSISKNLINLSIALEDLGRYEEGQERLMESLSILAGKNDSVYGVMTVNRLGRTSFLLEEYSQAIYYFEKVLEEDMKANNWEKAYAFTGLAEVYHRLGKFESAKEAGLEGMRFAEHVGAVWDLERVSAILSKVFEESGDYANALKYTRLNKVFSDSLYNEAKDQQLAQLHLKLSQSEIAKLKVENELTLQKIKRKNYGLFFSTAGFALLVGLSFMLRRNLKQKDAYTRELTEKHVSIESQKRQIQEQNHALQHINQTKDKLLSIVAHDLRSPLHSILQILELYREGCFEDGQKDEALDLLYSQVVKTDSMLTNILKWVNEQIDNINPKFEVVFPVQEVEELLGAYAFQAKSKDLEVCHERADSAPIWVDRGHFQLIVQNLLHNAIKFTPRGGVIRLYYTQGPNSVSLHIRDTGNGLDEEAQSVFNSSGDVRIASKIGTANETGSGLGLMLVRQFVVNNKGSIHLVSDSEQGTEFVVTFMKVERAA
ncbi:hypothetical protein ADIS_0975 [Lunatimonas lonarensis]|uniref:histidine kinase n=1 Tax=Lunatimonas lonarensis TaxID=1232681 RepID=R7ZWV1_9BACT|nr:tetratricopeptide repeat protein [Lunatimonas lonarensis]EON78625.1 hypothetical protein ADIS_0975 [Lunatimonas lonarensis]